MLSGNMWILPGNKRQEKEKTRQWQVIYASETIFCEINRIAQQYKGKYKKSGLVRGLFSLRCRTRSKDEPGEGAGDVEGLVFKKNGRAAFAG
ncbi:MAG: hypothetical protein J5871_04960 [Bacteroidales bacterium]|nr:hypothetical protein [Bacteroidales bacterium]